MEVSTTVLLMTTHLNADGRPISAYGALDLPTYFIDVTPFVPLLADGKSHNFTIDVASAEANHSTLQNWFVSGALYVVTDPSTRPTIGKIVSYDVSPFAQSTTKGSIGDIGELEFSLKASRRLRIESEIVSGSGVKSHIVWSQSLAFSNSQIYRVNGTVQVRTWMHDTTMQFTEASFVVTAAKFDGKNHLFSQWSPSC